MDTPPPQPCIEVYHKVASHAFLPCDHQNWLYWPDEHIRKIEDLVLPIYYVGSVLKQDPLFNNSHPSTSWWECFSFSSGRVGMVTVLLSVVRTERLLGLWKGISPVRTPYDVFLLSPCVTESLYLKKVFPFHTLLCHPSVLPVLCSDHPRGGDLLQHILFPKTALLLGQKPRGVWGCAAGGWGPDCGRGVHAACHCHQDTFWSKHRGTCVILSNDSNTNIFFSCTPKANQMKQLFINTCHVSNLNWTHVI